MSAKQFILTTLSLNPEYAEETLELIEKEFHYQSPHHFEEDFSPLMTVMNAENCYLLIDQEQNCVAAHLAVCPRELIKNKARLPVAFIGGIVTAKAYRGQQLFRQLMEHALNQFQNKVGMFILWSEIDGLYEKFQFHRSGGLIESGKSVFDSSERPIGYEKTKFSKLSEKDFERICHLYQNFNQKYFFTVAREDKDWSLIREMNSVDLYIKRNLEHEIERYFCLNKGRDLTNIIHEISSLNKNDFLSMLKEISHFKLWLPESEQQHTNHDDVFYTAFMRLGSPHLLNQFLIEVSLNQLKMNMTEDGFISFSFKNETFKASQKEFLQYIFGPKPIKEFESLGLSLYVAGVDSI